MPESMRRPKPTFLRAAYAQDMQFTISLAANKTEKQ